MTDRFKLSGATPRVPEELAEDIVRLDIEGVSQTVIARRLNVHRHTVARVLDRTRAAVRLTADLAKELQRAIEVYRHVQTVGWSSVAEVRAQGHNPASLLAEIRLCQARIDSLLALEPVSAQDPRLEFARFRATVVELLATEAPDVALRLAAQLDAIADQTPQEEVE